MMMARTPEDIRKQISILSERLKHWESLKTEKARSTSEYLKKRIGNLRLLLEDFEKEGPEQVRPEKGEF